MNPHRCVYKCNPAFAQMLHLLSAWDRKLDQILRQKSSLGADLITPTPSFYNAELDTLTRVEWEKRAKRQDTFFTNAELFSMIRTFIKPIANLNVTARFEGDGSETPSETGQLEFLLSDNTRIKVESEFCTYIYKVKGVEFQEKWNNNQEVYEKLTEYYPLPRQPECYPRPKGQAYNPLPNGQPFNTT
jgi:hypothetical protein